VLNSKKESNELSEKMGQLKLVAEDGKMRETDVADTEQLFQLIHPIPSPKAEQRFVYISPFNFCSRITLCIFLKFHKKN
jgi:hypothetical protein